MDAQNREDPEFHVAHEPKGGESLLIGTSNFGLAGLTAVDYLIDQFQLSETGHISTKVLPAITPFEQGRPRHHTRLFTSIDEGITVLVGELFVPVWAADSFSEAILNWSEQNNVREITILAGIPIPHGPEEHRTFYIATDDYVDRRIEGSEVPPMQMGFLDGVNASLMERGIDTSLAVGVLVTPVHTQAPDIEAALRLISTYRELYSLDLDLEPLETFAAEVANHYQQLSERLQTVEKHEIPEDRMYM